MTEHCDAMYCRGFAEIALQEERVVLCFDHWKDFCHGEVKLAGGRVISMRVISPEESELKQLLADIEAGAYTPEKLKRIMELREMVKK